MQTSRVRVRTAGAALAAALLTVCVLPGCGGTQAQIEEKSLRWRNFDERVSEISKSNVTPLAQRIVPKHLKGATRGTADPLSPPQQRRVELLIEQLGGADWVAQRAAIDELVAYGPQVGARIEAILKTTEDESQLANAFRALGELGDPQYRQPIEQAIRDAKFRWTWHRHPRVLVAAVEAAGLLWCNMGTNERQANANELGDILTEFILGNELDLATASAEAMVQAGWIGGISVLIGLLKDTVTEKPWRDSVGNLIPDIDVVGLREFESGRFIRTQSLVYALGKMTFQDFGADYERWKDWWDRNHEAWKSIIDAQDALAKGPEEPAPAE